MKSLLPIILVILVLTGAITFSLAKRSVPQEEVNRFGIPANELDSNTTPDSTETQRSFFGFNQPTISSTPTPTATPTIEITPTPTTGTITPLPTTIESDTTKGGQTAAVKQPVASVSPTPRVISRNMVCTPIYGQADTCTEHIVVDTGAENAIFFNLAGLSYLAGLVSFVKAKSVKK